MNLSFNCDILESYEYNSDREKIIYHLLERAVVSTKDIPDYALHKNKNQFYVLNSEVIKLDKAPYWSYRPLKDTEKPTKIGEVSFCWKSKEELQEIANSTDDYLYLSIKNLNVNGNKASASIDNGWITNKKNKSKYIHMSGGGYTLQLIKVDGNWIIDPNSKIITWIS